MRFRGLVSMQYQVRSLFTGESDRNRLRSQIALLRSQMYCVMIAREVCRRFYKAQKQREPAPLVWLHLTKDCYGGEYETIKQTGLLPEQG